MIKFYHYVPCEASDYELDLRLTHGADAYPPIDRSRRGADRVIWGAVRAVDLSSGTAFFYTSCVGYPSPNMNDIKSFDDASVVTLRHYAGVVLAYRIGSGGVRFNELTLMQARRLEEICATENLPMPPVAGYAPRAAMVSAAPAG